MKVAVVRSDLLSDWVDRDYVEILYLKSAMYDVFKMLCIIKEYGLYIEKEK